MSPRRTRLVWTVAAVLVAAWLIGIALLVVMANESFPLAVLSVLPLIVLAALTRAFWTRRPDGTEWEGERREEPDKIAAMLTKPLPRYVSVPIALALIAGFLLLVRWAIHRFVD